MAKAAPGPSSIARWISAAQPRRLHLARFLVWIAVAAAVGVAIAEALMNDVIDVNALSGEDELLPAARPLVGPAALRRWEARGRYLDDQGRVRPDAKANYR